MESEIFIGPTYYMRLKHMVKDKVNYRALGPRTALTKQPVGGRANDGGLRIGEMERDTVISHGIGGFLQESMMERGDLYYMAICNHTGTISVYNPARNLFMSPMVDGPLKYVGSLENSDDLRLEHMTKYGRSFSIVAVPYSFKLLIQELQTINVQLRIITEDNIDQITNMTSNANVEKLTLKGKDTKNLMQMIRENIRKSKRDVIVSPEELQNTMVSPPSHDMDDDDKSESYHPITPYDDDEKSESYHPMTPDMDDENFPGTPSGTPPGAKVIPESPAYAPTSPDYPPKGYAMDSSEDSFIPPPPPPEEDSEESIQTGGRVCLKDDVDHPTRPWEVSHIGDKFITIRALDDVGLGEEDQIKVVRLEDVYSEIAAQQFAMKIAQAREAMAPQTTLPSLPEYGQANAQPNIIIAPKFFNGNGSDNSIGNSEQQGAIPDIVEAQPLIPAISSNTPDSKKDDSHKEVDFSKEIKITKV
jgi:hypothetical protein